MAEGEVLSDEGRLGTEEGAEGPESEPNESEHGARIRSGGGRRGCSTRSGKVPLNEAPTSRRKHPDGILARHRTILAVRDASRISCRARQ